MAVQMYLIQPTDNQSDEAREMIADFIAACQGFILMATSYGSLIVAVDERYVDSIKVHHLVSFVGGVMFNPEMPGVAALQRKFAENIMLQLASRGSEAPGIGAANNQSQPELFPPGYSPLRWPVQGQGGGGE